MLIIINNKINWYTYVTSQNVLVTSHYVPNKPGNKPGKLELGVMDHLLQREGQNSTISIKFWQLRDIPAVYVEIKSLYVTSWCGTQPIPLEFKWGQTIFRCLDRQYPGRCPWSGWFLKKSRHVFRCWACLSKGSTIGLPPHYGPWGRTVRL